MKNIKARMEHPYAGQLKIEIESRIEPDCDGGELVLSATVKDGYTGRIRLTLDWYYDFIQLMKDLDLKIKNI